VSDKIALLNASVRWFRKRSELNSGTNVIAFPAPDALVEMEPAQELARAS
jgi:hypothetical protein